MKNDEKIKKKIIQKLGNEMNDFLDSVKKLSVEEIIEKAYEIACMEEIKSSIIFKTLYNNLTEEESKVILNEKDVLKTCYEEWIEEDTGLDDVFENSILTAIEYLQKRNSKEIGITDKIEKAEKRATEHSKDNKSKKDVNISL